MSKIITVANQKGGIAKTTTAMAMAIGLKNKGYRTLLVDFDPQCNASDTYGAVIDGESTLYDVLCCGERVGGAIQHTTLGDIVPCDPLLKDAEKKLIDIGREYIFSEVIGEVSEDYDYIILDTPPSFGILLLNALMASNGVVIPINSDRYAVAGLSQLNGTIEKVKKYGNKEISIDGLLLCKYNPRLRLSKLFKDTANKICDELNTKLYTTYIRESVAVREAQANKTSLYAVESTAATDYTAFIDEFLA